LRRPRLHRRLAFFDRQCAADRIDLDDRWRSGFQRIAEHLLLLLDDERRGLLCNADGAAQ
jgi:hypothetical protein